MKGCLATAQKRERKFLICFVSPSSTAADAEENDLGRSQETCPGRASPLTLHRNSPILLSPSSTNQEFIFVEVTTITAL